MWADACGQIFFSLGICMGIMTSYNSYNPVNMSIIGNSLRVSIGNCCFSFFCGFAVFGTVGYLQGLGSKVANKVSSNGLAFIAFPAAIDTLPYPNFWIFILAVTLFTLGIDSAFSMIEATSTVITDTPTFSKMPRKLVALVLCSLGSVLSFIFCFNWGFTYFDVVDHYLAVYLLLLLGVFQCFGAAWVYEFNTAVDASNKMSVLILGIVYFGALIPLSFGSVFLAPNYGLICMVIFWVLQIIAWIVSFMMSKLSCKDWY
jgi:SNF family Na+-dependent transporter